jgi:SNF2 family DNA or RNA helicase
MEGRKTDRSEDQAQTQLVESRGEFSPLLVIVPSSLLDNWRNEFETWGYFAVSVFRSAKDRDVELHRIKIGMNDILVCTSTLFSKQEHFARIEEIPWKLIIVDEFHCYKNRKTKSYQCLSSLRNVHRCPIIGMTGTLMSNNHEELWSLVDLVQPGILGMRRQFIQNFSQPIKLAR